MKQNKRRWLRCAAMLILCCLFVHPLSALAQTFQIIQIWNDVENRDGLRPSAVPVTIEGEGVSYTAVDGEPLTLPDGEYTFTQGTLPDGYTSDGPFFDPWGSVTKVIFINSRRADAWKVQVANTMAEPEPETCNFTVTKEWRGTAQDSITLYLYADKEPVPDAQFIRQDDTYTVYDLPVYAADGHKIVYSATEQYMAGYMTMYLNVGEYKDRHLAVYNGGTIVNRETVDFEVKKEWVGISGDHPEIRFQLYQNGEPFVWRQPEPDEEGVYAWEYLPKMKLDEESEVYVDARYYVVEEPLEGYYAEYMNVGKYSGVTDRCYAGGTIINYKVPKTGDDAPLTLWYVATGIGAAGLIVLAGFIVTAKKRRKAP